MAKSVFSQKSELINKPRKKNADEGLSIGIFTLANSRGKPTKVNIRDLGRKFCMPDASLVRDRSKGMKTLITNMQLLLDNNQNKKTLLTKVQALKKYFRYADNLALPALSQATLKVYHAELSSKIKLFNNRKPFLFQHSDQDELGLTESGVNQHWTALTDILDACGLNTFELTGTLRVFSQGQKESFEAYSKDERDRFLNRVQDYFFGLAFPLIANKNTEPQTEITLKVNETTIVVKEDLDNDFRNCINNRVSLNSPFNQAMLAGYYLLSYYSAFNDSPLVEIAHPIRIENDFSTSISKRWYKVEANKWRANHGVSSKIGGSIVKGELAKTGLKFIQSLVALSKKYNHDKTGSLFYTLREGGTIGRFIIDDFRGCALEAKLFLTSSNKHLLADHLVSQFISVVTNGKIQQWKKVSIDGFRRASVKWVNTPKRQIYAPYLAFAAIHAISKKQLNIKGALSDLNISKLDDGSILVRFSREDESTGELICDEKYLEFINILQRYCRTIGPFKQRQKTPYLIPFGNKHEIKQWEGLAPRHLEKKLFNLGIRESDFYIKLNTSRLRETSAYIARLNNQDEITVSRILNNSFETSVKHYSEGNPDENKLILSEALQILEIISKNHSLHDAKQITKNKNNLSVLTLEEIAIRKGHVNAAGYFCEGGQKKPNEHYATARRAKKLGFNKNKLPCFQYDNCVECIHAKLVDDVQAAYKQLSFIDCLEESLLYYPETESRLKHKVKNMLRTLRISLSQKTQTEAFNLLLSKGRHPFFKDTSIIASLQLGVK